MDRTRIRHAAPVLAVALSTILAAGCLQLETRIKLNEDGSAIVTERIELLRPLLEMEAGVTNVTGMTFEKMISRERAVERAAAMGKGVTLVSHAVGEGRAGSRVSKAVYKAEDIAQMVYMTPFVMRGRRIGAMKVHIQPQYKNNWSKRAGILWLRFINHDKGWAKGEGDVVKQLVTGASSPVERQQYRDLAPAFRDLMRGFRYRMVFESYGPILGTGRLAAHGSFARPLAVDIVNWSYDTDGGGSTGTHPLDSEEVVTDLMKLTWAPNEHGQERIGRYLGPRIGKTWFNAKIRPSRHYFDKYFAGKELIVREAHKGRPAVKRPARFEQIGERGQDKNVVREKK